MTKTCVPTDKTKEIHPKAGAPKPEGNPERPLSKSYSLTDALPEHLLLALATPAGYFYVPTQAVVRQPGETFIPHQGRYFRTNTYADGTGAVREYREICGLPDFKGTCDYDEIMLVEQYLNAGNNAFEYVFDGYALIRESVLKSHLDRQGFKHRAR